MDLDELIGNVIPLDDAVRLARRRGPMSTKDEATTAKLIETAFADLEAVVVDNIDGAVDAMRAALAEFIRSEHHVRWLAKGAAENPGRWHGILMQLDRHKTLARHLRSAVQEAAKTLGSTGTHETRLKDMTDRGLLPPPRYVVRDDGVWVEEGEQITTRPIYIVGRGRNIVRDAELFVRLRWAADADSFDEMILDRAKATNSRSLQEMAAKAGAPVTSANALNLTRYLDAFETQNLGGLPVTLVTNRIGWQPNGSFMIGAQCFGLESVELVDAHRASDWRCDGEWEEWLRAYEMVAGMPLMVLAVVASCAAPLLTVLDAPGFVVDWSGETSVGKTSALRMAASVWGVPDAEAAAGPMGTWKSASTAGPLAAAAFRHSLPLILDDTKEGKPDVVQQLLYEVPSGRDRSRADRDGSEREPRTWRTVLLSSGEAPILSFSRDGGARARTIVVQGPPMGEATPINAGRAEHVKDLLMSHHGHLGERVISELMARPDHYCAQFARHRNKRSAGLSGVAARVASHLAVLDTAQALAEAAGMPRPRCRPVDHAAECLDAVADSSDPPTEALRALYAYCAGNPHLFEGRSDNKYQTHGLIGVWRVNYDSTWDEIAITPQVVEDLLRQWRYDASSVLESWVRRGWRRMIGTKRLNNPNVTFGPVGARPRMVVIKRTAIDEIEATTEEE